MVRMLRKVFASFLHSYFWQVLFLCGFFILTSCSCDAICEANRKTLDLISDFEQSGNPGILADWVTADHGEGPGQQVLFTFTRWGNANPTEAEQVLDSLEKPAQQKLGLRLAATSEQMEATIQFAIGGETPRND